MENDESEVSGILANAIYILLLGLVALFIPIDSPNLKEKPDLCPQIVITADPKNCHNSQRRYSVRVSGIDITQNPTFKWNVSAGKIIKGQNTGVIVVDAHTLKCKTITVTIEVSNVIPEACPSKVSYADECSSE